MSEATKKRKELAGPSGSAIDLNSIALDAVWDAWTKGGDFDFAVRMVRAAREQRKD